MARKPFSHRDCKENDPTAKAIAARFLESTGQFELQCPLAEQEEVYKSWDFFIFSKVLNKNISVEVQRKLGWKMYGRWQPNFPTVHIEERKISSLASLFIMFNFHWNTLLAGSMQKIREAPVITKDCLLSNGTILKDDRFFELYPKSFDFYRLDDRVWRPTVP